MNERAVRFGEGGNLVGILTEPEPSLFDPARPGAVFLNSGILHRVGASRLYVQAARRLAARGIPTLRFDHSGVGDSELRRDDRSVVDSAVSEVQEAMSLLSERKGVEQFILFGLCSGADMAYFSALEDERVTGLVQIDPFLYRARGFYLRHYLPRLFSPKKWLLLARTLLTRNISRGKEQVETEDEGVWVGPEYTRPFPRREEVAEGLARLRGRDVAFYVYVTGTMLPLINHAEQYRRAFPGVDWGDGLQVDLVPDSNHTMTGLEHQRQVCRRTVEWMEERWGEGRKEEVGHRARVGG